MTPTEEIDKLISRCHKVANSLQKAWHIELRGGGNDVIETIDAPETGALYDSILKIAEQLEETKKLKADIDELMFYAYKYDDKRHQLYNYISVLASRYEPDAGIKKEITRLMEQQYLRQDDDDIKTLRLALTEALEPDEECTAMCQLISFSSPCECGAVSRNAARRERLKALAAG